MKTLISYECDVCGRKDDEIKTIRLCEEKGRPERVLRVGVGWENLHHEDHKDGTDGVILVVSKAHVYGRHVAAYSLWGWRDTKAGDNGPDANEIERTPWAIGRCGGSGPGSYKIGKTIPKATTPRWKRARAELARRGIKLIRWDGTDKCFEVAR